MCLKSELLRYQDIHAFAKNDTENAELASKMLKQQHFLHQRKNLYNPVSRRSSSGETNTEDNHVLFPAGSLFFLSHPRTLYWAVYLLVVYQRGSVFGGVVPTVS